MLTGPKVPRTDTAVGVEDRSPAAARFDVSSRYERRAVTGGRSCPEHRRGARQAAKARGRDPSSESSTLAVATPQRRMASFSLAVERGYAARLSVVTGDGRILEDVGSRDKHEAGRNGAPAVAHSGAATLASIGCLHARNKSLNSRCN